MYKLYGGRRSGSAMIEAALAEVGAPYELVPVDLGTDEQRGEAYRRVNPTAKIPSLALPSGAIISESAAILITLAERHPEAGLLPPLGSDARAQAIRWLIFVNTEVYPMIEIDDYPMRFTTGERGEAALKFVAQKRARQRWLLVEEAIAGSPWLLESGFSIADLAIANVSRWTIGKDWRAANLPKIDAVHQAVLARPKAGSVWTRLFQP